MKDQETITVVQSININPTLDASTKLDLVRKVMNDCREKKVGKILIEAIEKKTKTIQEDQVPKKRGRGRPRKDKKKELTENQKNLIKQSKEDNSLD